VTLKELVQHARLKRYSLALQFSHLRQLWKEKKRSRWREAEKGNAPSATKPYGIRRLATLQSCESKMVEKSTVWKRVLRSRVSKWALLATHDLGFLENPVTVDMGDFKW